MNKRQEIIKKDIEKLQNITDDKYLRLILTSYVDYNHRARLDIAKILYNYFLTLPEIPNTEKQRICIFAEIYVKLMESIEDLTLLTKMFTTSGKTPLEIYTSNQNVDYYKFLAKAKKGFSREFLLKIYGLETVPSLITKGYITKEEEDKFNDLYEYILFGKFGDFIRWRGFGKVYTNTRFNKIKNKKETTKSGAVAVYHNIKHAYKVFVTDDLYKEIWTKNEAPMLAIFDSYTELKNLKSRLPKEYKALENKKVMKIGSFDVTKDSIKEIYERIHPCAQTIRNIAEFHLGSMIDPAYPVKELRFLMYMNEHTEEPKTYIACPCGSGKKYKKCHRFKYENLEYLYFGNN